MVFVMIAKLPVRLLALVLGFCVAGCASMFDYRAPQAVTEWVYNKPKGEKGEAASSCDVTNEENRLISPWKEYWESGLPVETVYAACECQWKIYKRNERREKVEKSRFGLSVAGAIVTGVSGGATATLGAVVAGSDAPSSSLTGVMAGVAALTAVAGIMTGIVSVLPTTTKQNGDSALAWQYWTKGMSELAVWKHAAEGSDEKGEALGKAHVAFAHCASDHEILGTVVSPDSGQPSGPKEAKEAQEPNEPDGAESDGGRVDVQRPRSALDVPAPRLIHG
ncbi:hypothetical protein PPSIR1_18992 [Plesiocystis pacifica SIR-1]|uniref:Lipoprotein n=2 Tax=Plesiocystis pacifica TaxID=191768 RepID=A6GGL5_9BACT|nr:hypothetical protein PPSIR1_18992 [Plesiocystis pacifica SIR-1]